MIFCFVIKFPKGTFDIYISLVQVEINFLLTSVVSFKISPVHTFAETGMFMTGLSKLLVCTQIFVDVALIIS